MSEQLQWRKRALQRRKIPHLVVRIYFIDPQHTLPLGYQTFHKKILFQIFFMPFFFSWSSCMGTFTTNQHLHQEFLRPMWTVHGSNPSHWKFNHNFFSALPAGGFQCQSLPSAISAPCAHLLGWTVVFSPHPAPSLCSFRGSQSAYLHLGCMSQLINTGIEIRALEDLWALPRWILRVLHMGP